MTDEIMENDYPDGFFNAGDILAYRELAGKVPFKGNIMEIGVYKGRSLCSIAHICRSKMIRVMAVDSFRGDKIGQLVIDKPGALYRECVQNLSKAGLMFDIISDHSTRIVHVFHDEAFDLIFIDASHDEESVAEDIKLYLPKVKIGGYIAGHDYKTPDGSQGEMSVKKAVDANLPGAQLMTGSVWAYRRDK
jgi:hypothetical protein